jgi:hypothetical protein
VLVGQQAELILFLQQEIGTLRQEIERLKHGGKPALEVKSEQSTWVKPNQPASEVKPRKKQAHAFTRPCATPNEEIVYTCPAVFRCALSFLPRLSTGIRTAHGCKSPREHG